MEVESVICRGFRFLVPSVGRTRLSRSASALFTLALVTVVAVLLAPQAVWADPIEVQPSWEQAPWQGKVQTILNVTAQIGLSCCVFSLLAGGAAMGVGKVIGSYQAGHRGLQLILGGGGGALVIASTASIVSWLIAPDGPTA
jgi:hypothetical protein